MDDDHEGRGELVLVHRHDGRDLKLDEAQAMLSTIERLWQRPVRLYTLQEGEGRVLVAQDGASQLLDSSKAAMLCA